MNVKALVVGAMTTHIGEELGQLHIGSVLSTLGGGREEGRGGRVEGEEGERRGRGAQTPVNSAVVIFL